MAKQKPVDAKPAVNKRTDAKTEKTIWQKTWHFLWHEDSVASWVVSILLAFILIKFVMYPIMGLVLGTQFPIVAVVSDSMEHDGSFDEWWTSQEDLYLKYNITKNDFEEYTMHNGFNKGDLIVLLGAKPEKLEKGDIIVFWGGKEYPIIHRVVEANKGPSVYYQTKGDHNRGQIINPPYLDERHISQDVVVGRAVFKIPYLGWVKIGFVNMLNAIGIRVA